MPQKTKLKIEKSECVHQSCFYALTGLTSGLEVVKLDKYQVVVSGFATAALPTTSAALVATAALASGKDASGLIALRPDTGQELWRQGLKALPRKHDCNLVDVNNDGLHDCLVVGDSGLLTAIDPRTGKGSFINHVEWEG